MSRRLPLLKAMTSKRNCSKNAVTGLPNRDLCSVRFLTTWRSSTNVLKSSQLPLLKKKPPSSKLRRTRPTPRQRRRRKNLKRKRPKRAAKISLTMPQS